MTTLMKYEAARAALTEAHRVDEVKDIRDKAAAMQVYARQAKDRELIDMATDIKLRAERRAGELLRDMPKNRGAQGAANGRDASGGPVVVPPEDNTPKLADLDITKNESSRWQKLAAMPEEKFEEKLASVKDAMRGRTEGGKPKGSAPRSQRAPKAVEREEKVGALKDAGLTVKEISRAVGLGERAVNQALEHVDIKREAVPDIDPAELSMSAQKKLAIAIRQHQTRLAASFQKSVNDEVRHRVDDIILPDWKRKIEEAKKIYNLRRKFMSKEIFNTIRRALHPDSRKAISDKKLAEAFDAFMALEKFLLDEKDSPTEFGNLPSSLSEWDKMKANARTAKRTSSPTAVRRR